SSSLIPLMIPAPTKAEALPPLPIQFSAEAASRGRVGSASGGCHERDRNGQHSDQFNGQFNGQFSEQSRAIAYTSPDTQNTFAARTSQAQPTLWFYLSAPISEATETIFVLKNSLNAPIYEGRLTGQTERAGIVGVPLSTNLAVGDLYQWSLTFSCVGNAQPPLSQNILSGWIERRTIDPTLRQTFDAVGDRNRAALYANYGFLQDTLSQLAMLRRATPNNEAIVQDWSAFLSDLNLSELTDVPLLSCCQLGEKDAEETEITQDLLLEAPELEATELETTEPETPEPETPEIEEPTAPEELIEEDSRTTLQRARDKG
ncbi:MAG: DUF928 domain-containing protein, partial [Cyanobacteria bacterium P01_D01_bin.105]